MALTTEAIFRVVLHRRLQSPVTVDTFESREVAERVAGRLNAGPRETGAAYAVEAQTLQRERHGDH